MIALMISASMAIQVGSGLRRRRLSKPVSRRFTSVMARMVKQEAMTP